MKAAAAYGMLYMVDVIRDLAFYTTQSIVPTHTESREEALPMIPTVATSHVQHHRYMRKHRCAYGLMCIHRNID